MTMEPFKFDSLMYDTNEYYRGNIGIDTRLKVAASIRFPIRPLDTISILIEQQWTFKNSIFYKVF